MKRFPDMKVSVLIEREIEFDGYKGVLTKTEKLNVSDFELVQFIPKVVEE